MKKKQPRPTKEGWDPYFNNGSKHPGQNDGPYDPFKALPQKEKPQDDF